MPALHDSQPADRGPSSEGFASELFGRLRARRGVGPRYSVEDEVGAGGMSIVFRARDGDLRRDLAMKVLRVERDGVKPPPGPESRSLRVARFLEEAQVSAQLDHPGIVPVHELGLDADDRLFFTMKLVRGETLKSVIDRVHAAQGDWSVTRAVSVVLKVCEAVAYAHQKRVVHRDLKPGNVMVGRFGEVFVMDWGLARLLDKPDRKDIRIREPEVASTVDLESERHDSDSDAGSPLYTMDGDVVGTPAYMSPEQAHGKLDQIGPQTDVYSAGAILYHLLTGSMPYVTVATRVDNYAIWRWVREGPPAPLEVLAPEAPDDLLTICNKAMERDTARRYASMGELADDLRAYLEGRPIAHETGPIIKLKKWVVRNKAVAASLASLIVVLVAGALTIAFIERRRATDARNTVDEYHARAVRTEFHTLPPIDPAFAPVYANWIERLRGIVDRSRERPIDPGGVSAIESPSHIEARVLRERADQFENVAYEPARKSLATPGTELDSETLRTARATVEILSLELPFWRAVADSLELASNLSDSMLFDDVDGEGLSSRQLNLARDVEWLEREALPQLTKRLELATTLVARCWDEPEASKAWERAIREIADDTSCPAYGGLRIARQLGLVPLGLNDRTGLYEFWHVLSGEQPTRGTHQEWRPGGNGGLIFVLVPGGTARLGARDADGDASSTERPVQTCELGAFFLSKYEMTQGQWIRLTGENPSEWWSGMDFRGQPRLNRSHPVERLTWHDARRRLALWSLDLPTESQWECGARAGGESRYVVSDDFPLAVSLLNGGDRAFAERVTASGVRDFDDGWVLHAPVGTFAPNAFGLFDVLGNVAEWCEDAYADSCVKSPPRAGDGLRHGGGLSTRSFRGGSFRDAAVDLRVSKRLHLSPDDRTDSLGVRPARALDPAAGTAPTEAGTRNRR